MTGVSSIKVKLRRRKIHKSVAQRNTSTIFIIIKIVGLILSNISIRGLDSVANWFSIQKTVAIASITFNIIKIIRIIKNLKSLFFMEGENLFSADRMQFRQEFQGGYYTLQQISWLIHKFYHSYQL